MELKETQKKRLRTLAHTLSPVVMVGQHGLKPTTLEEVEIALEHHQLIKVKLSVGDRELRDQLITEMLESSKAILIQRIGNVAVLYRKNPERADIFKVAVLD